MNTAVDMRESEMTSKNFPKLSAYDIGITTQRNIFLTKEVKKKAVNKIGAPEE
jgi:hypothetical protein